MPILKAGAFRVTVYADIYEIHFVHSYAISTEGLTTIKYMFGNTAYSSMLLPTSVIQ